MLCRMFMLLIMFVDVIVDVIVCMLKTRDKVLLYLTGMHSPRGCECGRWNGRGSDHGSPAVTELINRMFTAHF